MRESFPLGFVFYLFNSYTLPVKKNTITLFSVKSVSLRICDYRVRRGWNTGGICRASRSHSGVILHHKQNLTTRSDRITDTRQHPHPGPEKPQSSPSAHQRLRSPDSLRAPPGARRVCAGGSRAEQVQPALPCLRASAGFTARPCLVSSPLPPVPEV
ncbi:unnamed protein product [Coccothraustes coccothraustes]